MRVSGIFEGYLHQRKRAEVEKSRDLAAGDQG
jgi:hypothetical protein